MLPGRAHGDGDLAAQPAQLTRPRSRDNVTKGSQRTPFDDPAVLEHEPPRALAQAAAKPIRGHIANAVRHTRADERLGHTIAGQPAPKAPLDAGPDDRRLADRPIDLRLAFRH